MKDFWKSGIIALLIIGVLYVLYLRECKHEACPPEGYKLLKQVEWDSILALANKPPEVRVDTFWRERPVIKPNPQPSLPKPNPIGDSDISSIISDSNEGINVYYDSLIKRDINVWADYIIQGTLLDRVWRYKPISEVIRKDSIVYVPKIVEVEKVSETTRNEVFLYGIAGVSFKNNLMIGIGADYVTKKDLMVGYQYQSTGLQRFHSIKLGTRIWRSKN